MRARRDRDSIGPLTGWGAFFHRVAMFILFPLRKPLIFFPVLLLFFLAPTFRGVKPAEVHLWYWRNITHYTGLATDFVKDKSKDVIPENISIKMPSFGEKPKASAEKGIDKLVEFPTVDVNAARRAMFEKAKTSAPVVVDIEPITEEPIQPESETVAAGVEQPAVSNTASVSEAQTAAASSEQAQPKKKLPLIYLETPKEVIGVAKVFNANEVEIDGTYIFLYGIYVNPDTEQGIQAKRFLEEAVKNEMVRCSIVAYTFQEVATGMCYVGSENLNQLLVKNKLSKDVAL